MILPRRSAQRLVLPARRSVSSISATLWPLRRPRDAPAASGLTNPSINTADPANRLAYLVGVGGGSPVWLRSRALQALFAGLIGSALALLGGCVYREAGPPEAHFDTFASKPPQGDSVTVCHAYGCKAQTSFTLTPSDLSELFVVMTTVPRDDGPREERRAIANAIGWMERRVAPAVGTATDRASRIASMRRPTPRAIYSC